MALSKLIGSSGNQASAMPHAAGATDSGETGISARVWVATHLLGSMGRDDPDIGSGTRQTTAVNRALVMADELLSQAETAPS